MASVAIVFRKDKLNKNGFAPRRLSIRLLYWSNYWKSRKSKKISAFNQQINSIEWNKSYNDLFGEMLMRFMKPLIVAKGGNSTTLPISNKGNFEKLEIIKPPLPLQKKFATLVEQVEQLRVKQRESEKELENLFGSLMQRYFG